MTTLDPGTVDLDAVRDKIDAYKALDDQIKILTETKASLRRDRMDGYQTNRKRLAS